MDIPRPDGSPENITYRLWPFWTTSDELYKATRAIALCVHAHSQEKRKYTGNPYYTHPIRVAMSVASYPEVKFYWILAALLHDVIEDWKKTPFKSQEEAVAAILAATDQETLDLVWELTNVKQKGLKRPEQKAFDRDRLYKASRAAKIIKLLDRIDNLHDMGGAPVDFKKLYLEESRQLYEVLKDADKNLAWQLMTVIDSIYKWRHFSLAELEMRPAGMVMEHVTMKNGWISEAGPGGKISFESGAKLPFTNVVFRQLMRETGDSK